MGIPRVDTLGDLKSILELTKGKSQTSTTTNSTQSNITTEGAQELINQILRSTQGLAAVSSGQKSAGLYNSTVNQQLINDLMTQTAAKVAAAQAGTTSTNTVVTKNAPTVSSKDLKGSALILAGLQGAANAKKLLGPVAERLGKKLGIESLDDLGDKILDTVGLGAASGGASLGVGVGNTFNEFATEAPGLGAKDVLTLGDNPIADISALASGSGSSLDVLQDFPDVTTLGGASNALSLGDGKGIDLGVTSPVDPLAPDGELTLDYSKPNFSTGSDASAPSTSDAFSADFSYIKAAKYADNPKSFRDIFNLSDGDAIDDISDVTDAVSTVFPIAGLVRPALKTTEAAWEDIGGFAKDPGDWTDDFLHGDSRVLNNASDLVEGAWKGVMGTVDLAGRAGQTTIDAVEDVFSSIGDVFGW